MKLKKAKRTKLPPPRYHMCYNPRCHTDTVASLVTIALMGIIVSLFAFFGALERSDLGAIVVAGYILLYTACAVWRHNKHMAWHASVDREIEDAAHAFKAARKAAERRG